MSVRITIELPLATVAALQAHLDTDDVVLPELDTVSASVRAAVFDAVEALPYHVSTAPPIATKMNTPAATTVQPKIEKKVPKKNLNIDVRNYYGKSHKLVVPPNYTIEKTKERLYDMGEVSPDTQRLIFRGKQLLDSRTLEDYEIEDGSVLHLIYALRGS